jgi:hypothetical protein
MMSCAKAFELCKKMFPYSLSILGFRYVGRGKRRKWEGARRAKNSEGFKCEMKKQVHNVVTVQEADPTKKEKKQ